MRTVPDFPTPPVNITRLHVEFIRSKSDPHCLIRYDNGDVFTREDGDNWKYPAYKITRRELDSEWGTWEMRGAYCDDATYDSTITLAVK